MLRAIPLILGFICVLASSEVKAQTPTSQSLLDVIKQRGTLLPGVRKDFPPAGFIDKNGEWVGFEIDLSRYIADKLGVKYQPVEATSRTRIPLLQGGNVDFIMMTMNPTVERSEAIDWSSPYFFSGVRVLVKKGQGLTNLDSFAGKKVAGVQGSSDTLAFAALQPKAEIAYFQQYPDTMLALKNGQVAGVAATDFLLVEMSGGDPQYELVGPEINYAPWVIGVRQNDTKWRLTLDKIIQEAWVDGTYEKLYAKYFKGPIPFKLVLWPDYFKRVRQ